jgi:hypothetical protein
MTPPAFAPLHCFVVVNPDGTVGRHTVNHYGVDESYAKIDTEPSWAGEVEAVLLPAAQYAQMQGECVWTLDDDTDSYDGTCGVKWCFMEGDVRENELHYCPRCGKAVRATIPPRCLECGNSVTAVYTMCSVCAEDLLIDDDPTPTPEPRA